MLHLCFAGGLRVSELVGLRLEDMVLQPQANVLIHGKGRKERCLPLWNETASAVRAWLSVRGEVRVPELFPNARNDAMTAPVSSTSCASMSIQLKRAVQRSHQNGFRHMF